MPNIVVDQAKLVMNTFATIFQNNLISADVATWKQFDGEMNDRDALTVVEQVKPRYVVTQTVAGVADLTAGVQDTVFGSEQFICNRVFGASMGWGDFQRIRDIGDARESEAISQAALNLAEQIDAYVMGVAAFESNNWVGTPGSPLATYQDVISGYTRLKQEGVDDSDLRIVLNFDDKQALAADIINNRASLTDTASGVYRKGFDGEIGGIPTMFTQQLPVFTPGSRAASGANIKMNGANQNVNYKAVAVSPAPGQFMTQTINITIGTGSETLKDGEVFTISGVNAYDNRLQASLGRLQQFRVIGDYTAASGVVANCRIFPALVVAGSGTGSDIGVNQANATVDSVPGAAALITFLGTASTAVRPRFINQKSALVVNTRDLIKPATGMSERKTLTKIPLSVRMWRNSNFNTGEHDVRFDVALTANVRDRRRCVRINGA